jgi:hypothetical protein
MIKNIQTSSDTFTVVYIPYFVREDGGESTIILSRSPRNKNILQISGSKAEELMYKLKYPFDKVKTFLLSWDFSNHDKCCVTTGITNKYGLGILIDKVFLDRDAIDIREFILQQEFDLKREEKND